MNRAVAPVRGLVWAWILVVLVGVVGCAGTPLGGLGSGELTGGEMAADQPPAPDPPPAEEDPDPRDEPAPGDEQSDPPAPPGDGEPPSTGDDPGSDGSAPPDGVGGPATVKVTPENLAELVAVHRPNELGRVLILEYHDFKDEEERWARRWDNFRKDLEMLYERGYRAVSLRDYLSGTIDLPPGTSPVIFTFDDGLMSQLRLIEQDGEWVAHPQSAVGIMLAFAEEHPDFGVAGTFYVTFTPVPFREPETWKEKLRFLVAHGFEVAQHAEYHEDLSKLSDEEVRRALGRQVARMREVLPDYDGFTIALPFGLWPQNRELAIQGEWEGVEYHHRAVLLVGSDPVYSPYDRRLDVMALPRVQAIDSEFARWMPFLDEHRYISDGDPSAVVIPEGLAEYLSPEAVGDRQVFTYTP